MTEQHKAICKIAANIILQYLLPRMKKQKLDMDSCPVTPLDCRCLATFRHLGILSDREVRAAIKFRFGEISEADFHTAMGVDLYSVATRQDENAGQCSSSTRALQ